MDQIIGLKVLTVDGKKLGCVSDIMKTGSNDVYVVNQEEAKLKSTGSSREILIPALKSVVKEINLQEGYILVELPEGLLD